jgi:hypothetical protein
MAERAGTPATPISQRVRKRIEEVFGWLKTVLLRIAKLLEAA